MTDISQWKPSFTLPAGIPATVDGDVGWWLHGLSEQPGGAAAIIFFAAATADMGGGGMVSDNQISLVFDSDGTCRPFELLIRDGEDGECNIVRIDRWGKGKVEPYEE